jgi:HPt (histidine-containing phosphotransfer) domain-containing protein
MSIGNGGTPRKDADPVLDETCLSDLATLIGQEALRKILLTTRNDLAQQRRKLGDAATSGDVPLARKVAHTLVGTCAQIGAVEVKVLASFIEKDADTLDEIRALMLDLNTALDLLDANLAVRTSRHDS